MDEDYINDLIQKCRKLKYKFCGVFAANNFPQKQFSHRKCFTLEQPWYTLASSM